MKIKLINKTAYSSRDLRTFLHAGFRELGAKSNKVVTVRYLRVVYRYTAQLGERAGEQIDVHGPAGRGSVGRPGREAQQIWLHLPRDHDKLIIGDVAHTLYHELLHNRGALHRDMTREQLFWNGVPAPWCAELKIGLNPQERKLSREERAMRLVEKREAHARAKLKEAQTRLKRARTIERIWNARVRYYEKVAAKRVRR